ncbi:hypothetical protein PA08_1520 [Cutibacterium modestum P08]|nr:hypothetical protein PA08_1520 [Cutibacterium modestum P08]
MLYLRTRQTGPIKLLTDEQIKEVSSKIHNTNYGQSAPAVD